MTPYHQDVTVTLWHGACLDVLPELPDNSVDCVVTDPPYGLEFMGKDWDRFKPHDAQIRTRTDQRTNGAEKSVVSVPESYRAGKPFQAWCEQWAAECLRILKPGGHLLAFGGTRTWHRLTCAVEDAGFEIRDSIAWLYGSGFPKSLDVSKAIDRAAGAEREVVGSKIGQAGYSLAPGKGRTTLNSAVDGSLNNSDVECAVTAPATPEAEQWQGWGTALKPAHEPIVVARKPLEGTVAQNVLRYGTGALNIDATRVGGDDGRPARQQVKGSGSVSTFGQAVGKSGVAVDDNEPCEMHGIRRCTICAPRLLGRWPANVVLDESQAAALDQMSGESVSAGGSRGAGGQHGAFSPIGAQPDFEPGYGDTGGASRFFYTAPADPLVDSVERAALVQRAPSTAVMPEMAVSSPPGGAPLPIASLSSRFTYTAKASSDERITHNEPMCVCGHSRSQHANDEWGSCLIPGCWCPGFAIDRSTVKTTSHPTVKPLSLMRWLVRLVTPPGGTILEPFAGSGTTVEAAILEGFRCIAIEREADYLPLITQRVNRRHDPIAYIKAAGEDLGLFGDDDEPEAPSQPQGRWPANVVLDRSQAEALDQMSGESVSLGGSRGAGGQHGTYDNPIGAQPDIQPGYGDTGGASRFFKVVDDESQRTRGAT